MSTITLRTAAITAVVLAFAAGSSGAQVPRLDNDREPAEGSVTITLEPRWTIGDTEDGALLGTIERVLTAKDGRIWLMDSQLSHVLECSPEGEVVRTLGRGGDGPGELTNPRDMVRFADGTLGLVKMFPGKIVLLASDGSPAGTIKPSVDDAATGGFLTLHRALQTGGTLLLGGSVMTMDPGTPVQTRTFFLSRFERDGSRIAELTRAVVSLDLRTGELHESWQEFVWSRMDVASDGTVVVCIPRDALELSWFSSEGTLLRSATLPVESWKRNKRAHDRMFGILAKQADHVPGTEAVAAPTEPAVVDLFVRGNGEVWCLTARSMWEAEEGTFACYDVFDDSGRYARRVRVICDGDAVRDRLLISGDRAFLITGYWDAVYQVQNSATDGAASPMAVTCFRIR
ncbi:hypothetical protein ACFL6M_01235 [Candidatus Eisenbacteria bacterium]|uniref:6-bladed beta-propeller n=1 Tax=Eiseniibacteriota bacterium TaxID=2212470 RepID=A0ABV6YIN9_UNCEI